MLVKLDPNNIYDFWDAIGYSIESSIGFSDEVYMSEILISIMQGILDVWISYDENLNYITTGYLNINPVDKSKSYVMFSMFAFNPKDPAFIKDDFDIIRKYATKLGCSYVQAFTDHINVKKLASEIGFKINNNLILRL